MLLKWNKTHDVLFLQGGLLYFILLIFFGFAIPCV